MPELEMDPRRPLTADQIVAAVAIRSQLPEWQGADAALRRLAAAVPAYDVAAALLKVAAINVLYGTNVYAVQRMATHIETVLGASRPTELSPELVEHIADLPGREEQEQTRRHVSFASKFCHFFVDQEAFPVYDAWARKTVARHLGQQREIDATHPYLAFVRNLERLRGEGQLTVPAPSLDSYLWIRGAYEAWRVEPAAAINGELKRFFTTNDGGPLLGRLIGQAARGSESGAAT